MANYDVEVKVFRGAQGEIETMVKNYINSLDDTKAIRGVSIARYGADNLIVLLIHDA